MVDTTDIEKKSLEAHVELCAERYKQLDSRLESVDANVSKLEGMIKNVQDMLTNLAQKRNDQVLTWAGGIIAVLLASLGYLISVYVIA